jgi:hypothetical protein
VVGQVTLNRLSSLSGPHCPLLNDEGIGFSEFPPPGEILTSVGVEACLSPLRHGELRQAALSLSLFQGKQAISPVA